MRKNYDDQLNELKEELVKMGKTVNQAIRKTVRALKNNDLDGAKEVIAEDAQIDEAERNIENACLKIILTQQPVASDMRVVSSALKMITDLERMGDFAADIAEIVESGGKTKTAYVSPFLLKMSAAVVKMVEDALLSFTERDLELAKAVCRADDEVDGLFIGAKDSLVELIRRDESYSERALDLMMVSKYLERIGDHATNLAEWVIYSITGEHINTEKGF